MASPARVREVRQLLDVYRLDLMALTPDCDQDRISVHLYEVESELLVQVAYSITGIPSLADTLAASLVRVRQLLADRE
jgi:hypothetical protein